jgi:hypothetical protein
MTIASSVLTTADINGGTIDNATIATSNITVGAGKTLNVSAGTLTLADNQISGDKVEGGTISATTITTLTSTTGNITNVNATTVDTTNLEVTNLKAKDGTSAGSIANSTGVVTLASSVLTTTDINGGTIDGTAIGGASAAAGSFTTLNTSGAVVFNDAGANVDFRVESDNNANMLFVDAGNDFVSVGDTPGGTKVGELMIQQTADNSSSGLAIFGTGGAITARMYTVGDVFTIGRGTDPAINIDASKNIVINEDGNNQDFRVEGDTDANLLFVDASTDRVGIGTFGPPSAKLTIQGTSTASTVTNISNFSGLRIDGSLADTGVTGITFQDGGGGGAAIGLARGGGFNTDIRFYTNPNSTATGGATTERMRITSDGALSLTGPSSNGNGAYIRSQSNQSVASGGTVTVTATTAGAVLVMAWNNTEGTGLICFGSNAGTMTKLAGTGEATDTGSAHAIYKTDGSVTITYKNKYGGTRNVWIAVYSALAIA